MSRRKPTPVASTQVPVPTPFAVSRPKTRAEKLRSEFDAVHQLVEKVEDLVFETEELEKERDQIQSKLTKKEEEYDDLKRERDELEKEKDELEKEKDEADECFHIRFELLARAEELFSKLLGSETLDDSIDKFNAYRLLDDIRDELR